MRAYQNSETPYKRDTGDLRDFSLWMGKSSSRTKTPAVTAIRERRAAK